VACEISAGDEILVIFLNLIKFQVTELLFLGIFNDMEPAMIAATLSALVLDENNTTAKQAVKSEPL